MKSPLIPELYCPFPSRVNKYVDLLEDYATQWVMRFDLVADESAYQRFLKAKFYLLIAGCYPDCELEELKIANDWLSWQMTWDITCETSELGKQPEKLKTLHQRFIEVLNGAELKSDDIPRTRAFHDLRQRILQAKGARTLPYFVSAVNDYLRACMQEATNFKQSTIPDVETYIALRRLSASGDSYIELIEFIDHLTIPDFVREHNIIKELKLMTNNILAWCNDIFSAPKEIAEGDFHNLVLVLQYQQQIPLEQAFKLAAEMHDREIINLLDLEASIPSFGKEVDAEVAKYITGLHSWIRGNLDWSSTTARYHSRESLERQVVPELTVA